MAMSDNGTAQPGWRTWLGWVVASSVGLAIGLIVFLPVAVVLGDELDVVPRAFASGAAGAVLGAAVGGAQWLVLRRRMLQPGSWVWASIAGGAVGGAAGRLASDVVAPSTDFTMALVLGLAVLGACLGFAQWLVWRGQSLSTGWWVVASAAGLAGGILPGRLGSDVLDDAIGDVMGGTVVRVLATVIFGSLTVAGYGAITGGVMVWRLRRPKTGG
jgi:hypothetical protein